MHSKHLSIQTFPSPLACDSANKTSTYNVQFCNMSNVFGISCFHIFISSHTFRISLEVISSLSQSSISLCKIPEYFVCTAVIGACHANHAARLINVATNGKQNSGIDRLYFQQTIHSHRHIQPVQIQWLLPFTKVKLYQRCSAFALRCKQQKNAPLGNIIFHAQKRLLFSPCICFITNNCFYHENRLSCRL